MHSCLFETIIIKHQRGEKRTGDVEEEVGYIQVRMQEAGFDSYCLLLLLVMKGIFFDVPEVLLNIHCIRWCLVSREKWDKEGGESERVLDGREGLRERVGDVE